MAKSIGKTVAAVVILSSVALSCAATAISVGALTKNEIDWGEGQASSVPESAAQSRSIVSIEKTETLGLVDKYTITYSDGTTSAFLVTNGKDGEPGIQGLPGPDGRVPAITVGANGNWFVDGVDQNIRAEGLQGPKGDPGKGIEKIEKTNTYGLIDEYTITYTDNTTSVFLVTNGQDGQQGIQGMQGPDGHTPAIEIGANGNWFIDNVDSGVSATGQAGPAGQNGKSAYELAVDNGYTGTLEEWLLSLVGAAGAVGPSGQNGKSAYELAVDNGYTGTETEWLTTLVGAAGQDGQNGADGMSAYQIYCESNIDPDLSEADWLASLYGEDGQNGKSAYEIYIAVNPGSTLSESEWLESLVGQNGQDGRGIASIAGPETSGLFDTYTINYSDSTTSTFVVRNGADGQNGASLLTGSADPEATVGESGDSYINTTTWEYFTKSGNSWTSQGTIKGTNGSAGVDGRSLYTGDGVPAIPGNSGDSYIDLSSGDYYVYDGSDWALQVNVRGDDGRGIATISLSSSTDETDTYTISFTDSSSTTFQIAKPRSIVSIAKTSTSDLVDTYTITYSYGSTSTFTVTNGEDGKTIYHGDGAPDNAIGVQGDVYIDTTSCNMYFKGMTEWGAAVSFKGDAGKGIASIAKTDTNGLEDEYTITYTDSTSTTFTVTNGADGKDGTKVVTGVGAPASMTGYQEGDSYIDTATWNYYVLIQGASELEWALRGNIKGTDGTNGTRLTIGDTDPSSTTGHIEGDSFLNTSTWDFFVLEDSGSTLTWVLEGNIHNAPNTYTVTFDSDGGDYDETVDVVEGCTVPRPYYDPDKSDYYFQGWYTDDGTRWDFVKDIVSDDITLTARWGQLQVTDGIVTGCSLSGYVEIPYVYEGQLIRGLEYNLFSGRTDITKVVLPNTITEIPDGCFESCSLAEAVLPESLVTIGDCGFSNCDQLRIIDIPDTVTRIKDNAFIGCTSLEAIAIPASVQAIPDSAFYECTNLKYVTFKDPENSSVASIGQYAFWGCSSLERLILPNSVTSIDERIFNGSVDHLIQLSVPYIGYGDSGTKGIDGLFFGGNLPASLTSVIVSGDAPVVANAFSGASSVENIVFTGNPSGFGLGCLAGATNLVSLELPYLGNEPGTNTKSHLGYLFGNTQSNNTNVPASLVNLEIRGGVLNYYAFSGCGNLERVVLGDGLTEIQIPSGSYTGPFRSCNSLKYLEIPFLGETPTTSTKYKYVSSLFGGGTSYSAYSSTPASLETIVIRQMTAIIDRGFFGLPCKTIVLPDTITSIGQYAFSQAKIESLVIPESVTTIGLGAFSSCYYLKSVKLPNNPGFTQLPQNMFLNSNGLEAIVIPDNVTSMDYGTFNGCVNLVSVDLGDGLTVISESAFSGCKSLRNIRLGESLTTIGRQAFQYCDSLESVYIPLNVTEIKMQAFADCTSLANLRFDQTYSSTNQLIIQDRAFQNCLSLVTVNLPDRTIELNGRTFSNCKSLVYVRIPNGLTTIGGGCFEGDISLTSFVVTSDVELGSGCFNSCTGLVSLTLKTVPNGTTELKGINYLFDTSGLPKSLKTVIVTSGTSLPDNAFYECKYLTTIILPDGLTSIGQEAFYNCSSLTSITLPNTIETIGSSAFKYCTSLISVEGLGDWDSSVTTRTIGDSAFRSSGITTLRLYAPSGKTLTLEQYAFTQCKSLVEAKIAGAGTVSIGNTCFEEDTSLSYLEIGDTSTLIENVSIGSYAFQRCTSLLLVNNRSSNLIIGAQAFRSCSSLVNFRALSDDQTNSIKSIGAYAFASCWSLKTIDIDGVTTIGAYAFGNCDSLRSILMPDTLTSLGGNAFAGCTDLESVRISSGLTSLPEGTFFQCSSLTNVTLPSSIKTVETQAFYECRSLKYLYILYNGSDFMVEQNAFYSTAVTNLYVAMSSADYATASANFESGNPRLIPGATALQITYNYSGT